MKSGSRERLDQLLVERHLVESREKAKALILAGQVLVDGQKAAKPGHAIAVDADLQVLAQPKYVSRGGLKLEAALEHFGIAVQGLICLDVGASTGGFTDCLLQRGAARVYAIDTGRGQIDWRLRTDPRVVLREGVNARHLATDTLGEAVDLAVCDVSFISAVLVLEPIVGLLKADGRMIILVKPQFEVGRGEVGKGGIVRDPALHAAACAKVEGAVRALGFLTGLMESPILGAEGNREFLLYAAH
jgi:23S rRNA (cytidine1920-2'-O)/16S rRNA (cytidine1409-2'-O)-methyltransferase